MLTRWKELKSIHRVVRKRLDKRSGKTREEMVYYISSSTASSLLRQSIRAHWEIENNLHHCVECVFGTLRLSQESQEYSTDYGYYPKD